MDSDDCNVGLWCEFYLLLSDADPPSEGCVADGGGQGYFAIILASGAAITINIAHLYSSVWIALKHAFFQVATIITTTGFATADFDKWPSFSKTILFLLMICGACAGSTGGGIKVSRLIVAVKSMLLVPYQLVHPRSVKKVRMDGAPVGSRTPALYIFLTTYFLIFGASVLLISVDGFDFETNMSAVAATLNNIGPGFSVVGPTGNFSRYSCFSKIILIFDMLAGRLELLPVLIMLYPKTWKMLLTEACPFAEHQKTDHSADVYRLRAAGRCSERSLSTG